MGLHTPRRYVAGSIVCYDVDEEKWRWTVHLDLTTDETAYRAYIHSPPVVADLEGDGSMEVWPPLPPAHACPERVQGPAPPQPCSPPSPWDRFGADHRGHVPGPRIRPRRSRRDAGGVPRPGGGGSGARGGGRPHRRRGAGDGGGGHERERGCDQRRRGDRVGSTPTGQPSSGRHPGRCGRRRLRRCRRRHHRRRRVRPAR